jgi:hypothetical protein
MNFEHLILSVVVWLSEVIFKHVSVGFTCGAIFAVKMWFTKGVILKD